MDESRFTKSKNHVDGLENRCVQCQRNGQLKFKYGISLDQYNAMLVAQGGGCAVCGGTNSNGKALAVDHDHNCCPGQKTCGNCVRELLCAACNHAIGLMRDEPQRLRDAAAYLDRFQR